MGTRWVRTCFIFLFGLALALPCGARKKTDPKEPPPPVKAQNPDLLKERIRVLDMRWEILQKDNPPQPETGMFRLALAEAKSLLEENKPSQAEPKITAAEDWLNQNEEHYYDLHKQAVAQGKPCENAAQLWAEAEKFWAKEAENFMNSDKDTAAAWGKAGFAEGELAVAAAIASDMPTLQKVDYCVKLANKHAQIFDNNGAMIWRGQAKKLIDDRVEFLSQQLGWCLSGTVPMCELATVRASQEDYSKARTLINDSWKEINDLVNAGNSFAPGGFKAPDLGPAVASWNATQEDYFDKVAKAAGQPAFKDFETQQNEERAKQKEIIDKYNRFYCADPGVEASTAGLHLASTDVNPGEGQLQLRILIENKNQAAIYKPKVRLCGGIVSDEVDLGYPRFPANFQTSFSITAAGYILESSAAGVMELPRFWALVTFEDDKGKQFKVKAILRP